MLRSLRSLARQPIGAFYSWVTKREYLRQTFRGYNERSVEYAFVFQNLARFCPKTVLDVGTGITALPQLMRTCGPLVTAIDNITDYWPDGMLNRHYYVLDDDILHPRITENFDMIVCISTLEHIDDYDAAISAMFDLLAPGGRLVLTFPYCEKSFVPNVYALPGSIGDGVYPFGARVYSRKEIDRWEQAHGATTVIQEYWRFFSGDFWTLGERTVPPVRASSHQLHQLSCLVLEKS